MQLALRLSLFALMLGICQAQDITVQIEGTPEATIVEGGLARMKCIVENIPANAVLAFISWNHDGVIVAADGVIVVADADDDYTITNTVTASRIESDLTIRNIELDEAGTYECVVSFSTPVGDVDVQDSVIVNVEVKLVVTAGPDQEAEVGDTATLLCNVTPSDDPFLTWYKLRTGGTRSNPLQEQMYDELWFGNLTIVGVKKEDNGTYVCEASNRFGDAEDTVDLIVLIAPEVTGDPVIDRVVQKEGTIDLDCEASGVRDPTYKWFFNGEELTKDNRTELDPMSGQLMIKDTVFADTGVYTCFAENAAGNDSQNNTIVIVGTPEIQLALQGVNDTEEAAVGENKAAVLSCPYIAQPDASVTWMFSAVGEDDFQGITRDGIRMFNDNGTLVIEDSQVEDAGTYLCNVRNEFGEDSRKITLSVIQLPAAPTSLSITSDEPDSLVITLDWTQPPASSPNREVDEFVMEVMRNDNPWETQTTFPNTATSGVVELLPGIKYKIRLRARNLAGVSAPSIQRVHETAGGVAELSFFNAEAQRGGRSVLLTWELEFTGGPPVEDLRFTITITADGEAVRLLQPDISHGEYLVTGLDPETSYQFTSNIINVFGQRSDDTDAVTTVAPPSKPTRPDIDDRTRRAITLAFSVDFGSAPITQFILDTMEGRPASEPRNLNDTNSTRFSYLSIEHKDLDLKERVNESGSVIGYDVKLEVSGLEKDTDYVFAVAAENAIGIGEFSDNSDSVSLEDEDLIYYIIGGVVGGMLLVVVVIIVVAVIAYVVKKRRKRTGKMMITNRGNESAGIGFLPPKNMNFDPQSSSSENIVELVPSNQEATSPPYNTLNNYQNGTHYNVDEEDVPGVDEPDEPWKLSNLPIVNPLVSSPAHSNQPPKHKENGAHATGSPLREKQNPESPVTEMPADLSRDLSETHRGLSHSTPLIDRNSYDMDGAAGNASYMTDV